MARVRDVPIEEVAPEVRPVYQRFAEDYGPFLNQVKVFAHRPPALKHVMGLLLDLAERAWASDLIRELALPPQLFPDLQEPGTTLGGLGADAAEALVNAELVDIDQWFKLLEVQPTLAAIRKRAETVAQSEIERSFAKRLKHLKKVFLIAVITGAVMNFETGNNVNGYSGLLFASPYGSRAKSSSR